MRRPPPSEGAPHDPRSGPPRSAFRGRGQELIVFRSGNSTINVYRSQYAGTNQATAVTWDVGADVEDVVRALKAKGVTFEHYDMPDMTRSGDIHVAGDMKIAWCKDPDGNILNITSA